MEDFSSAFPFFEYIWEMDFSVPTAHQHTHKAATTAHACRRSPRPHIALKALRFFLFHPHFHLKTIQTRWKMTRELRCNKWKFQIVVPFLWSAQRAHFLMFFFLLLEIVYQAFPPNACVIILIRFFSSAQKNHFSKQRKKAFRLFLVDFLFGINSKRSWRLFNCWKVEHVAVQSF